MRLRRPSASLGRRLAVACAWLSVALAGCGPGAAPELKGHRPERPTNVGAIRVTEVRRGEPSRPFALKARPGALLFVYFGFVSCPDICPTTLADLRRAVAMLGPGGDRLDVAFITVDLARDSAAALIPYITSFFPSGHALRPASQTELALAQAALGSTSSVRRKPDGELDVVHTAVGYVVDERGQVLVHWDFGTPPADMANDLGVLLGRVQQGRGAVGPGEPPAGVPSPGDSGLVVSDAWARATPGGATAGAAYLRLVSAQGDRLLAARVPAAIAARAELHEVRTDAGGAMDMRQVEAVALPAGREVEFKPGAHHVMLVGLARPLVAGDTLDLTLVFEREGERVVRVPVRRD